MPQRLFPGLPSVGPLRVIDRFQADPIGCQRRVLREILYAARDTEWGRRLGFRDLLRSPDVVRAFQERVPLSTYEDLRADAERIRRGTPGVTWPGRIRDFAVSSGTTSSGKIIPVSRRILKLNSRFSMGVGLQYLRETGNLKLLGGKILTIPGRCEDDPLNPGNRIGEVSGLQAEHAPAYFSRLFQAVPNEVSFLPDWEQKLDAIVDRTLGMDLRALVMVPSWAVVFLKRATEKAGVDTAGAIWPELQLFISGGVALSSYRVILQELIGLPRLSFLETYGASEGFIGFQDKTDDPALLLHLDNGVFYEFVRQDEFGKSGARRYAIGEVESGVRYTPYVSTCSGLWACNLGDVVRFTNTNPYRLVVAGRTVEVVDKYGEMVFAEEAVEALRLACERFGAQVRNFHLTHRLASVERMPAHQWLVEFEREPIDQEAFAQEIDAHLQAVNRHYQIRREAGAFGIPEIVPVPHGIFYEWMRRNNKKISGQTKVPRMNEERDLADGVLALIRTETASDA